MTAQSPPGFAPLELSGPFLDGIGPVLAREDGDAVILGLRLEERHLNAAGTVHGGLLATLADSALGRAIVAADEDDRRPATVSLTTDFLGPAQAGDFLEAHTHVERVGGNLAFADCSLRVGDREVVRARAVFAVLDPG